MGKSLSYINICSRRPLKWHFGVCSDIFWEKLENYCVVCDKVYSRRPWKSHWFILRFVLGGHGYDIESYVIRFILRETEKSECCVRVRFIPMAWRWGKEIGKYHIIIFPERTSNFISRKKRTSEHHNVTTFQHNSYLSINQIINQC